MNSANSYTGIDTSFHFPPELLELLVNTIPRLIKGKAALIDNIFAGAGVPSTLLAPWRRKLQSAPEETKKFHIARDLITKINEGGDKYLGVRRKLLQRVCEWEDFSPSYENDRLEAQGLVSKICSIVNKKDSFTRMDLERKKEVEARRKILLTLNEAKEKTLVERKLINKELSVLFGEKNVWSRGVALEGLLNRLFESFNILVRESFSIKGDSSEGIVEQLDGVIELSGHVYLVEMKWEKKPIGNDPVYKHLSRVFLRGDARGYIISASGFTAPAVTAAREALSQKTIILGSLEELLVVLENDSDLAEGLKKKIHAAEIEKNPYFHLGSFHGDCD